MFPLFSFQKTKKQGQKTIPNCHRLIWDNRSEYSYYLTFQLKIKTTPIRPMHQSTEAHPFFIWITQGPIPTLQTMRQTEAETVILKWIDQETNTNTKQKNLIWALPITGKREEKNSGWGDWVKTHTLDRVIAAARSGEKKGGREASGRDYKGVEKIRWPGSSSSQSEYALILRLQL